MKVLHFFFFIIIFIQGFFLPYIAPQHTKAILGKHTQLAIWYSNGGKCREIIPPTTQTKCDWQTQLSTLNTCPHSLTQESLICPYNHQWLISPFGYINPLFAESK